MALKVDRISHWGAVSEVSDRSLKLPEARRSGAPAAKNVCIFYVKKGNFSAFNCIICCNNILLQAWATYGPRARPFYAARWHLQKYNLIYRESSRRPLIFFIGNPLRTSRPFLFFTAGAYLGRDIVPCPPPPFDSAF